MSGLVFVTCTGAPSNAVQSSKRPSHGGDVVGMLRDMSTSGHGSTNRPKTAAIAPSNNDSAGQLDITIPVSSNGNESPRVSFSHLCVVLIVVAVPKDSLIKL